MKNNTVQRSIPQDWKEVSLGDLVSVTTGSRDANHGSSDGQYPFFTCAQKISKIDDFSFDTEAVLIAGNGDFNVKYYKGKFDAYQRTYVLSDFQNTTGSFIYQKAKQALDDIMRNNQGSSVKFIKMGDLTDYKFVLPPMKEQQKIAEILETIDNDIAKTHEVIETTEKLKRGLMQQLFTRGIGHTKFKEIKIGQIPEEWEEIYLSKIIKLTSGKGLSKARFVSGEFPVYGGNGVSGSHNEYLLENPTIIIGRVGEYCGVVHLTSPRSWVTDNALYVEKYLVKINQSFLFYLLHFLNLNQYAKVGGQPSISQETVGRIQIGLPNESEQKNIAEILSAVNEKISVNKKLKEKLTLLKKGLMQDLLSGKVRANHLM